MKNALLIAAVVGIWANLLGTYFLYAQVKAVENWTGMTYFALTDRH